MAITASDIHNQSFSIDRKGYDVDEVDVFLEHVADEIDILNDTIAHLQDQLEADRFSGFDAPAASTVAITEVAAATVDTSEYDAQLAQKDAIIADLERQLSDKRADDNAIAQALIIAQRSADAVSYTHLPRLPGRLGGGRPLGHAPYRLELGEHGLGAVSYTHLHGRFRGRGAARQRQEPLSG